MAERKNYDPRLVRVGEMLTDYRKALGPGYRSRNSFISRRVTEMFGTEWISQRHLANIEEGKNLPSIELLIRLAYALEVDPVDLFSQIVKIFNSTTETTDIMLNDDE